MRSSLACRSFYVLFTLLSLSILTPAFPTAENLAGLAQADLRSTSEIHAQLLEIKERRLLFDPLTTPIDVSGEHEFSPPDFSKGDQRGPCPGLNALANHGYLSRDGVVGFVEVIEAINTVLGMGVDLSSVLSVMGTVGVGNPLSLQPGFSIGGETTKSSNILGNLLGLLGTPRGLNGSHNWIEGDSSLTRNDLHMTWDASTMNMSLFKDTFEFFGEKETLSMDDMGNRAAERMQESIATNPYFYYGPFTGFVARNAGYLFAMRILANHSAEYPLGGHLTKNVFKSFWGVTTKPDGSLQYNKGWERIPENWYRLASDYGLVQLNLDLVDWTIQHPEFANVGGNMGEVNTFAGVDLTDLTGGLSMLDANYLVCFAMQTVKTLAPNSLSPLFSTLEKPLEMISSTIVGQLIELDCPAFEDLAAGGDDLLARLYEFPGVKTSGSAL